VAQALVSTRQAELLVEHLRSTWARARGLAELYRRFPPVEALGPVQDGLAPSLAEAERDVDLVRMSV
jgi:hypothetical protein